MPDLQYADLTDREFFPVFNGLPSTQDGELDSDFYVNYEQPISYSSPAKNWCFLSEITEIMNLTRLHVFVKDLAGRNSSIAWYTASRGGEIPSSSVKKGNTVAVLYAQRHQFLDQSWGIRLEDPKMVKLFPCGLDRLRALNDTVRQYAGIVDEKKTCHGCDKKGAAMKKCSRCEMIWYCDQACQAAGWNEKGHKGDCKLLKDPDVHGLFAESWDDFDDYLSFPLMV